jgi:recombination protein RecA
MTEEKDDFFNTMQKELMKNIKGVHVSTMADSDMFNIKDDDWIATPSLDLNRILSGSLHRGITTRSLVGVVGPEMSMKSSLLALLIADAQKKGFTAVLIDSERGATREFCERWGVDTDKLKIIYAPYIENAAAVLAQLLDLSRKYKKEKFIVGLDSLGALDTDKYFTGALKDDVKSDMGGLARATKALLKLFLNFCIESNSIGLICGHLYARPGLIPMPDQVGGGRAFRLFPNVLISMKKDSMKKGEKEVGNILTASTLKNRVTPPFQSAKISLDYVDGLDPYAGLFEYMLDEASMIVKDGNTFSIAKTGEKLGVGETNASRKMKEHPELLEELEKWLSVNKRYSQVKELKEAYESECAEAAFPVKDVVEEPTQTEPDESTGTPTKKKPASKSLRKFAKAAKVK